MLQHEVLLCLFSAWNLVDGESKELPVPWGYAISHKAIPETTRKLLEEKKKLKETHISDITSVIFDDISTKYNRLYLAAAEYDILAEAVLRQYPHLPELEELNVSDAKALWHKVIREKFRNRRKRKNREHPAVQKKIMLYNTHSKAKRSGCGNGTTAKNVWGVPNFLPENDLEDDDTSLEKFIEWMKKQSRLDASKQDTAGILLRMQKTFAKRRSLVVTEGVNIVAVKETYPLLFNDNEILREFTRLTELDLQGEMQHGLAKYADKLCSLPKGKGKKTKDPDMLNELYDEMSQTRMESERKYAVNCIALTRLSAHLREPLDHILKEEVCPATVTPYIRMHKNDGVLGTSRFDIYADSVLVCTTGNLVRAYTVLFASFYVFNLVYPSKCVGTLTFMQKCLCNVQDKVKNVAKVITLLSRLAK